MTRTLSLILMLAACAQAADDRPVPLPKDLRDAVGQGAVPMPKPPASVPAAGAVQAEKAQPLEELARHVAATGKDVDLYKTLVQWWSMQPGDMKGRQAVLNEQDGAPHWGLTVRAYPGADERFLFDMIIVEVVPGGWKYLLTSEKGVLRAAAAKQSGQPIHELDAEDAAKRFSAGKTAWLDWLRQQDREALGLR
jgi:hypothetical protein